MLENIHIYILNISKTEKSIASLYKTAVFLNQASLQILYYSLILPYFTYCVVVWGNTYRTNTNPTYTLPKRDITFVNKTTFQRVKQPTIYHIKFIKTLKYRDLVDFKPCVRS